MTTKTQSTFERRFSRLDGRHPLQSRAPECCVLYPVRRLDRGRLVYFNFALAVEMGLLPRGHAARIDAELERVVLERCCIQIINEEEQARVPDWQEHCLPHRYMATRYLQLQHPGRQGRTSGDGRSVWLGQLRHRGRHYDVSACGTGVTCLCPGTANTGEYFRTGVGGTDYSCGTAQIEEGLEAVVTSEILHARGVPTERVLAVIALPGGRGIHVRAAPSLLRPAHFFAPLKQRDTATLQALADLYAERRIEHGQWPSGESPKQRTQRLVQDVAESFGRAAAIFESEYLFVWLAWDGDNILMDGGILDYGSVRPMGLYHHRYRFDDGPRLSTTLSEQRREARGIVQNFAQIRDLLLGGSCQPLEEYRDDPLLARFDRVFQRTREEWFLARVGFTGTESVRLLEEARPLVRRLWRTLHYFERLTTRRGEEEVADGVTTPAIFSVRHVLSELPELLAEGQEVDPRRFLDLGLAGTDADESDRELTSYRVHMARRAVERYGALAERMARISGRSPESVLRRLARHARRRRPRVTGDSLTFLAEDLGRRVRRGARNIQEWIDRYLALSDLSAVEPLEAVGSLAAPVRQWREWESTYRHGL